jgi:hypothetical protein
MKKGNSWCRDTAVSCAVAAVTASLTVAVHIGNR